MDDLLQKTQSLAREVRKKEAIEVSVVDVVYVSWLKEGIIWELWDFTSTLMSFFFLIILNGSNEKNALICLLLSCLNYALIPNKMSFSYLGFHFYKQREKKNI